MNESKPAPGAPAPSASSLKREWLELCRHSFLLLALMAAIYAPVWLAGKTLVPWNGTEQSEWSSDATRPLTRTALDTADSVLLLMPWDAYALRCMEDGDWPWWNPYQGLGHPHWENIVTTGLSPGMWLQAALPAGLKDFVWLGQLWLAAIFTMMLARTLGPGWAGTLLAGVAIVTSPHFELYMTQRHMSGTAMWWPLALWGVECVRRSFAGGARGFAGTVLENRMLGFCGTAAGTWGLLTGGNPSITLAGGMGLFLYAMLRIPWRSGAKPVLACAGWLALGGASGLAMAAPAWLNFFPWLASCYSRMDDPIFLAGGQAGRVVFVPRHLVTLLLPNIYGQTMDYPFGPLPRWLWSAFGGWYSAVVVFLSLAGMARACRKGNAGLLVLAVMALAVIARSYGAPGTDWVGNLPLWRDVSFTRYAAFIAVFGFALLAGYGVEALAGKVHAGGRRLMAENRVRIAVAGAWLILMSLTLLLAFKNLPPAGTWSAKAAANWTHFAWLGLFWTVAPVLALLWTAGAMKARAEGDEISDETARVAWPAVFGMALAAVVFVPWGYSPQTHSALGLAGGLLLLLVAVCARHFPSGKWLSGGDDSGRAMFPRSVVLAAALVMVAALPLCVSRWSPHGLPPKFDPIPKGAFIKALQKLQGSDYSRSWSMDGLPMPNHAMPSGIFSLNVIDGLITREGAAYASKYIDPHCPPTWLAGNASFKRTPGETPVEAYLSRRAFYQFASVRHVSSRTALPGLRPLFRDESGMILLEDADALPRARLVAPDVAAMPPPEAVQYKPEPATGTAVIHSFRPNEVKIRVTNSKPCVLVLADVPKAGWSATLNGRPADLQTAHGCFRAVALPGPGNWEVEMHYRPPWWNASWLLAALGLVCFIVPCGWLLRLRKRAMPGKGGGTENS